MNTFFDILLILYSGVVIISGCILIGAAIQGRIERKRNKETLK